MKTLNPSEWSAPYSVPYSIYPMDLYEFARRHLTTLVTQRLRDDSALLTGEPIGPDLFSPIVARMLDFYGDEEFAPLLEVLALGALCTYVKNSSAVPHHLRVPAIELLSRRVVEILDEYPMVLHPHLLVPRHDDDDANDGIPVLHFLLHHGVCLDVDWLNEAAVDDGPRGQSLRAALETRTYIGDPLLFALRAQSSSSQTLEAVLTSLSNDSLQSSFASSVPDIRDRLTYLVRACALAAIGTPKHQDSALSMLDALAHRLRGIDSISAFPRPDRTRLLGEEADYLASKPHLHHPVVQFIYMVTTGLAGPSALEHGGIQSNLGVFPDHVLPVFIDRLNAVLHPDSRLSLEDIGGVNLLRLAVLAPKKDRHIFTGNFWNESKGWHADFSPTAMVLWALKRPDKNGDLIGVDEFLQMEADYVSALTPAAAAHFRALLLENSLQQTLSGAQIKDPPEPGARRDEDQNQKASQKTSRSRALL